MATKKPAGKAKAAKPAASKSAATKSAAGKSASGKSASGKSAVNKNRKPAAPARPAKPAKVAPARKTAATAKPALAKAPATKAPVAKPHVAKALVAKSPVQAMAKPAPAKAVAAKANPSSTVNAPTNSMASTRDTPPVAKPSSPPRPARPAITVVATAVPRSAASLSAAQQADPEDGEDGASLLAGPRNVKPYIAKRGEQYMNREQLDHFRMILQNWKRDLMVEVDRTVMHMKDEAANFPDPNDRATQEEEFSLELRTRDRERKLIRKIDEALKRIEDGSYGYCLETGEEIGIKRLEARPVATLSIVAQERRVRRERQYGDRDDRYR